MKDQFELQAFHVVLTTHNSRVSQRMRRLNLKPGPAIKLILEEEITLTKIFRDIVYDYDMKILAYNICKDHVHIIIVCPMNRLTWMVARLKGKSSLLFNRLILKLENQNSPLGHNYHPKNHQHTLWSQKFYQANLDVWHLVTRQIRPGYNCRSTHLSNAINYILHNRSKHQLPLSEELTNIITDFTCDINVGFRLVA